MPPTLSSANLEPKTVLVVGSGGREHALAWALTRSPSVKRVVVAPGNGGTAAEPGVANSPVSKSDHLGLVALAREIGADLVVVGPEDPLGAGLVDDLRAAELSVFGPTLAQARLETSKAWAREFMARFDVPHPTYRVVTNLAEGREAVAALGGRCVVKADGLAAGKGVVVADHALEAISALEAILERGVFGAAGRQVVVEQRLEGEELSVMAITDGRTYRLLPAAQDHKRLLDGETGPNTGGMGAYAPAPLASADLVSTVCRTVIEPTLAGMVSDGLPFTGCLFCGLMITPRGPVVIEFNVRFGDPETQCQLPLLQSDLAVLLAAAAAGRLDDAPLIKTTADAAVTVVLASPGYPVSSVKGLEVSGLAWAGAQPGLKVFHAGTARVDDHVVTTGGRVLAVTAWRPDLTQARDAAYSAIGEHAVHFDAMQLRNDIAARALGPSVPVEAFSQ
jgi:phosphoribosylamine--glycine ligase